VGADDGLPTIAFSSHAAEDRRSEDLQRELDARLSAKAFFVELSSQNRYAILYRLQDAKRPQTRARRLQQFVAMLEAGETIHPGATS
jgi:uncharacterized protein YdeI (YjbR/CyaY-like superfamily)